MEENEAVQRRSQLRKSEVRVKELDIAHFKSYINTLLSEEQDLFACGILPIPQEPHDSIFEKCRDGKLLARLVNYAMPGAVDEVLLTKNAKHMLQQAENLNIVLQGASEAGVKLSNIDPNDILSGNTTALLGLIWQIVKICQTVDSRDLQGRLELALRIIKEKEEEVAEHLSKIATLETSLENAKSQQQSTNQVVDQLKNKVHDLEKAQQQAASQQDASNQLVSMTLALQQTNERVATLGDEKRELQSKNSQLENEKIDLTRQLARLAKTLDSQKESIRDDVLSLQAQLAKKESALDMMRSQFEMQLKTRESAIFELQKENSSKQLQLEASKTQSETKQAHDELRNRYNHLLTKTAQLTKQLAAAESTASALQQKLDDVDIQAYQKGNLGSKTTTSTDFGGFFNLE
ncbi:UNVERIFIED_CONTAM: hypothetical protein HDU68_000046 [Siphonaria sp. JEL0065]|nr:hypothetical protein HDU68_000046 [Siphonaria sp. JEL0065]